MSNTVSGNASRTFTATGPVIRPHHLWAGRERPYARDYLYRLRRIQPDRRASESRIHPTHGERHARQLDPRGSAEWTESGMATVSGHERRFRVGRPLGL